eukprot:GHVH01016423.1.p1 GENE.GHVH01016423.1~~GHVH01016423.1.p1  ORF type:complete len:221 (+),score=37.82 GHVH01016423.1:45-665(+)
MSADEDTKTPLIPSVPAVEKPDEAKFEAKTEDEIQVVQDGRYEVVGGPEVVDGKWDLPEVNLVEREVKTGEEDEEVFWTHRAKMYRWAPATDGTAAEWKERATGDAQLRKHNENKRIRFLMRQEKTLKVTGNFYIFTHDTNENYCALLPNANSDKIWNWTCNNLDNDGNSVTEQLALKFVNPTVANEFKEKWDEAKKINDELKKDA